jgi:hypothetical protein
MMPRAMHSQSADALETTVYRPTKSELEFSTKLMLYAVLEPYRGVHGEREMAEDFGDPSLRSMVELRHDFLDKLSYLCDIEKNGSTTSAAALQQILGGVNLWIAANEGIKDKVFDFVEWVVCELKEVTKANHGDVERAILQKAVALAWQRMSFYRQRMLILVEQCRQVLKPVAAADSGGESCPWAEQAGLTTLSSAQSEEVAFQTDACVGARKARD